MNQKDVKGQLTDLIGLIKNPIIKFASYVFLCMVIGIGIAWILLGVCSPILLVLLILCWR
jgi:hypothetical protein